MSAVVDAATVDRFWSQVDKETGPVHPTLGRCWLWLGAYFDGYGRYSTQRRCIGAHRFACVLEHGPAPFPRADAAHACHNRACCRGSHLSWQTRAQNIGDSVKLGRHRCRLPIEKIRCGLCKGLGHTALACTAVAGPVSARSAHRKPSRRLTEADVVAIRSMVAGGERPYVVAMRFGISGPMASMISTGKRWKHVPFAPAVSQ